MIIKTDKAIYCVKTPEEYDWLMIRLEEEGCKWASGELPTQYNAWNKKKTGIGINVKNKVIMYDLMKFYKTKEIYKAHTFYEVSNLMHSHKDTTGKPKLSLVPPQIIFDIAEIREYGNKKYPDGGKDNWRTVSVEDYRDALLRHTLKYIQDPEGKDEESGIEHYKHMACNMAFICELEKRL